MSCATFAAFDISIATTAAHECRVLRKLADFTSAAKPSATGTS
jgi:hypothetical protein